MANDKVEAQPLMGFKLLKNPEHPALAVLVLGTANGETSYFVHKKALAEMSEVFGAVEKTLDELT